METTYTTYTVKGKNSPVYFVFKYDLNGDLRSFENHTEKILHKQIAWLFSNFPAYETNIREWKALYAKNVEITIGEPDLSFETFWKAYRNPVKKIMSQRAWNRLSKLDRRNAIAYIKIYDNYLFRKGVAKAAPSTYLNQKYWEDSHGSIA